MKSFFQKIAASLDNTTLGYSGRKLSSLAGVLVSVYITIKLIPVSEIITALLIWLSFSLLCLGIITVQQIIDFKNGKTNNTDPPT